MENSNPRRRRSNGELALDNVLSSEAELGPHIPDGGYGWVVFTATLFFQLLIPSLTSAFGIFLAASRLLIDTPNRPQLHLWDEPLLYVPLFFAASWSIFDPFARTLSSRSTWPRLVATTGTCLTCAGLLFLWMGLTKAPSATVDFLFVLAGLLTGIGSSIQLAQCEILLAQYFKLKHLMLVHVSHAVAGIGFVVTPIAAGHNIFNSNLLHIILWYQAIIMQGLVCNIAFKKPKYLKLNQRTYQYVTENVDEEDIFSKSLNELQIKRDNGIKRVEIQSNGHIAVDAQPSGPSGSNPNKISTDDLSSLDVKNKNWVQFDEDDLTVKIEEGRAKDANKWETFDEDDIYDRRNHLGENARQEMHYNFLSTDSPMPLFSDTPVNTNTTYSYDQDVAQNAPQSVVFAQASSTDTLRKYGDLLKKPTVYKSLLTIVTTRFSQFVFYSLFPCYLFECVKDIKLKRMSTLVGHMSWGLVVFAAFAYWINVSKQRRPIYLSILSLFGALGYFTISESSAEYALLLGGFQIVLSLACLQHIGGPLLGLTIRGETSSEYVLLSVFTGVCFTFFALINFTYRDCFRLMALLHFVNSSVWLSNFIYKQMLTFR